MIERLKSQYSCFVNGYTLVPCVDGELVSFVDHEAAMKAKDAEIEGLKLDLSETLDVLELLGDEHKKTVERLAVYENGKPDAAYIGMAADTIGNATTSAEEMSDWLMRIAEMESQR